MKTKIIPEAVAGEPMSAATIVDKRGYAQRWQGSTRWIDGLLAQGLPLCKIGARRVRILIPEADKWMVETFGTQRRAAPKGTVQS